MRRMWSENELENQTKQAAEEVIESGLVENAKPIYYHPIFIRDNSNWARITLAVLDNQATPYTWETLKTKLKALMDAGASIQCNGVFHEVSSGNGNTCDCFIMLKQSANDYLLYGYNQVGDTQYSLNIDTITASVFDDGVNKIN